MFVRFDGKKLCDARKKKYTQAVFAEKVDITIRYVRDLEHGVKDNPSAVLVYKMCKVLEVPMETLMVVQEETV